MIRLFILRYAFVGLLLCYGMSSGKSQAGFSTQDSLLLEQWSTGAEENMLAGAYDSIIYYLEKIVVRSEDREVWSRAVLEASTIVYYYSEKNQWSLARDWLDRCWTIAKAHGPLPDSVLLNLNNVSGIYYQNQGQFEMARGYLDKTLDLCHKVYGGDKAQYLAVYQNIAILLGHQGKNKLALQTFEQGLSGLEKSSVDSLILASYLNNMAQAYEALSQYELALAHFEEALGLFQSIPDHPERASSLYGIARIQRHLGDYEEAMEGFFEVLAMDTSAFGLYHHYVAADYQSLAVTYDLLQDYENSRFYGAKALSITKKVRGEDSSFLPNLYAILAHAYEGLGQLDTAAVLMKKAIQLASPEMYVQRASLYSGLGIILHHAGRSQEGLQYLKKAVSQFSFDHNNLNNQASTYNSLGDIYHALGQYDQALQAYGQEQDRLAKFLPERHPVWSESQRDQAMALADQGQIDRAMTIIEAAIKRLLPVQAVLSADRIPTIAQLDQLNQQQARTMYRCLLELARLYRMQETPDREKSLRAIEANVYLYQNIFDELQAEGSRLRAQEDTRKLIEDGLLLCWQLDQATGSKEYPEMALQLLAQSQGAALRIALRQNRAIRYAGLPDSLLRQEKSFRHAINRALQGQYNADLSEVEQQWWSERYFRILESYQTFQRKLEAEFPAYYDLRYQQARINPQQLQRELDRKETALLAYFTGPDHCFRLTVTGQGIQLDRLDWTMDAQQVLDQWLQDTQDGNQAREKGRDPELFRRFTAGGHRLYRLLFPENLAGSPRNLLIVPDARLSRLPFSMLLTAPVSSTAPVDYAQLPYLLQQYAIRYEYVINPSLPKSTPTGPRRELLAVAPGYSTSDVAYLANDRQSLRPLQYNRIEAQAIAQEFMGEVLLDEQATKSKFLAQAGHYRILHLAMHAFLDESAPLQSGLIFDQAWDEAVADTSMLRIFELYNHQIGADLVTLSACNTGMGNIQPGEGMLSLARAFQYAGCPSMVVSKWAVDDEATHLLMQDFYTYLRAGYTKSKALRQAKLDFLQNSPDPLPFFWSPFVVIGSDQPIRDNPIMSSQLASVVCLVMALIAFLFGYGRIPAFAKK